VFGHQVWRILRSGHQKEPSRDAAGRKTFRSSESTKRHACRRHDHDSPVRVSGFHDAHWQGRQWYLLHSVILGVVELDGIMARRGRRPDQCHPAGTSNLSSPCLSPPRRNRSVPVLGRARSTSPRFWSPSRVAPMQCTRAVPSCSRSRSIPPPSNLAVDCLEIRGI
jgi:hypothetical protein